MTSERRGRGRLLRQLRGSGGEGLLEGVGWGDGDFLAFCTLPLQRAGQRAGQLQRATHPRASPRRRRYGPVDFAVRAGSGPDTVRGAEARGGGAPWPRASVAPVRCAPPQRQHHAYRCRPSGLGSGGSEKRSGGLQPGPAVGAGAWVRASVRAAAQAAAPRSSRRGSRQGALNHLGRFTRQSGPAAGAAHAQPNREPAPLCPGRPLSRELRARLRDAAATDSERSAVLAWRGRNHWLEQQTRP